MEAEITNLSQLRARIAYLKIKKVEDEIYFNQKFESIKEKYTHPFKFAKNLLSSVLGSKNFAGSADWVTSLGRIFFPMILNKTLLRNSGGIIKTMVSLVSQKAINYSVFNKEVLAGWVDKITHLVKSKTKKEQKLRFDDYGIPPESETA
ncbi:MAG TPA: hypothetical protein VF273_11725 [Pelobium sp.]